MNRFLILAFVCLTIVIAIQAYFLSFHRTKYIYTLAHYNYSRIIKIYNILGVNLDSFSNDFDSQQHWLDQPMFFALYNEDYIALASLLSAGVNTHTQNPVTNNTILGYIISSILSGDLIKEKIFSLPRVGTEIYNEYKKHTNTSFLNKVEHLTILPLNSHEEGTFHTEGYNTSIIKYKDSYITATRLSKTTEPRGEVRDDIAIGIFNNANSVINVDFLNIDSRIRNVFGQPQDARLFTFNSKLYIIFNLNTSHILLNKASLSLQEKREMFLGQLSIKNSQWEINKLMSLKFNNANIVEKNWSPLIHGGKLYLVYSLYPELVILEPNLETGKCIEISRTPVNYNSIYAPIRGGTNFIAINDSQYIAFTHNTLLTDIHPSQKPYFTKRSYFMTPTIITVKNNNFQLSHITPTPILSTIIPRNHDYYAQVIFPSGLFEENGEYKVSIGVNDQDTYLLSIDKERLLNYVLDFQQ